MSKGSFVLVKEAFHLHEATLEAVHDLGGVCSDHLTCKSHVDNENRFDIVLKVPQKFQIANYVVSLSHNLSNGWTTAFIHGDHVLAALHGEDKTSTISEQIRALIAATPALWAHPLLLPTILLKNYKNRAEIFTRMLDDQVVSLEHSIGVTFAGRLRRDMSAVPQLPKVPSKDDMRRLTMGTHTVLTEVIFLSRVVAFNCNAAAYLLQTGDEISSRWPPQRRVSLLHPSRELRETARHIEFSSTSVQGFCSNLKERVSSQIQVLYSISAQTDNRLSARIAVSSGRDSTAMKTLAFITALFLPGTYIATLFSMSMFEWQASPSDAPSNSSSSSSSPSPSVSISDKFWIYWATTIPLTVAVVVGWRLWWVHEDRAYSAQLAGEVEGLVVKDDRSSYTENSLFWGHELR